ncbi:MAG TPA: TetR family transcriptional regulator [Kofleriaceae bacterium]|nr:TetR family transcriptional regulator [Kofleriaceae bacterium]
MARPANTDSETTKRRVLECALDAFAQAGYDGVSTRELAAAANVTLATINYHFASKQGLFEAAIDEVHARIARSLERVLIDPTIADLYRRAISGAAIPLADLTTFCRRLFIVVREQRICIRLLARERVTTGRLTERSEGHVANSNARWAPVLSAMFGIQEQDGRAAIVAVTALLDHFVIHDDDALIATLGVTNIDAAIDSVARSLALVTAAHLTAHSSDAVAIAARRAQP